MTCRTSNPSPSWYRRCAGFTLVEMLVVIGVITVLISLILPAVIRSRKAAEQAAVKQDLNAFAIGLEEYKNNYGQYPQTNYPTAPPPSATNPNVRGAKAMFEALSGKHWTGTALVNLTDPKSGRNLPALIQVDKFNAKTTINPGAAGKEVGQGVCFRDPDDNPYLYFPARVPSPDITQPGLFLKNWTGTGTAPLFNHEDCGDGSGNYYLPLADMGYLLGDGQKSPPYPTAAGQNGAISGAEVASTKGPYILWAAGGDRAFGLTSGINKTDDVTNFEFPSAYRK